jgi:hypothetical protein
MMAFGVTKSSSSHEPRANTGFRPDIERRNVMGVDEDLLGRVADAADQPVLVAADGAALGKIKPSPFSSCFRYYSRLIDILSDTLCPHDSVSE